ncbi:MAG: hypothetical protein NZ890_13325 [Myxococcota bacterium]|nr:hypothetical protein [Myxococcota bacterium]
MLRPGASYVEAIYTFYNPSSAEVRTSWGTITDSGAQLSTYHPGIGFGGLDFASIFTQRSPLVEYMAQQGVGLSYGVIPWPGVPDPAAGGVGFPISGVAVEVYDVRDKLEVFGQGALTLVLPPRGGAERRVAIGVGRGGVDSIERLVRTEVRPAPLFEVRGRIAGTVPGEELHVGVLRAGPDGSFLPYTALHLAGEARGTAPALGPSCQQDSTGWWPRGPDHDAVTR